MMEREKLNFMRRSGYSALMGLSLEGDRLEGVVLRRVNGSLQLQQSFSVALSLDVLASDPVLVGAEIRAGLDALKVHARYCVVCLPSRWALTLHTEIPDMPETDVASFLRIEAERGFACDVATLRLWSSRCNSPGDRSFATQIGIANSQLEKLEKALIAARLKPVSFTPGSMALQTSDADGLMLAIVGRQVELQVSCGGGIGALRVVEGALDRDDDHPELRADVIAREVRITLGQLPAGFRDRVHRVSIFGSDDMARHLAGEMKARLEPMGLSVNLVATYDPCAFGVTLPENVPVSRAFSFAARRLAGGETPCECLPPTIAPWKNWIRRHSSGPYRMAGLGVATVFLLVGSLFAVQQWQLIRLRTQWARMSDKVAELDGAQQRCRQFRPWFDDSCRCLSILRKLTEVFPGDGSVSARMVEIRDMGGVTCSGVAADNAALLKMLSRLRAMSSVRDVKLDQIRGKTPVQFTFNFYWIDGGQP